MPPLRDLVRCGGLRLELAPEIGADHRSREERSSKAKRKPLVAAKRRERSGKRPHGVRRRRAALIDGDAGRDGRATVACDPDMADRGCARRQIHDDRIAVAAWESETDGIGAERWIDPAGRP